MAKKLRSSSNLGPTILHVSNLVKIGCKMAKNYTFTGVVGVNGSSGNKANSALVELGLGLSLTISIFSPHTYSTPPNCNFVLTVLSAPVARPVVALMVKSHLATLEQKT